MRKIRVLVGFLLFLVFVGLVLAAIYWVGEQMLSRAIVKIANVTVANSTITLPNINGAESAEYDETGNPDLDDALIASISGLKGATLSVNFKNASEISTLYDNYRLEVIASDVPGSSSIAVGTTVLTVDLSTATDNVDLDSGGLWAFDYGVMVTAKNVTADTTTNAEFTFETTLARTETTFDYTSCTLVQELQG